jgi:hypothetical protein
LLQKRNRLTLGQFEAAIGSQIVGALQMKGHLVVMGLFSQKRPIAHVVATLANMRNARRMAAVFEAKKERSG